jgi:protein gp37
VGDKSAIEWTDATWNPVTGCTKVSPGCAHCYAETFAKRGLGRFAKAPLSSREFTDVRCHEDAIEQPLHWRKPRRIFVNSMSDLFHEDVPDAFIDRVFAVMALAPWHTFQILTKRAERMREYCSALTFERVRVWMNRAADGDELTMPTAAGGFVLNFKENLTTIARRTKKSIYRFDPLAMPTITPPPPFPNVWLGVSVENQHFADERIPLLLRTPAAVRFISAEPLLGPINLRGWGNPGWVCGRCHEFQSNDHEACRKCGAENPFNDSIGRLDWVIVGGESGPGARPFDLAWGRSIIEQCKAAGVPVFVKQLGAKPFGSCLPNGCGLEPHSMKFKHSKAGDPNEWPDDLHVREFPTVRA